MSWPTRRRKEKNKDTASSSPPDRIPFETEDAGVRDASVNSSLSSTINSGGCYSTPPSYHVDGNSTSSPLSVSPKTPGKEWEVKYKSYLSHVDDNLSGLDMSSDASTEFPIVGMRVPDLSKQHQKESQNLAQSLPGGNSFMQPVRRRLASSTGLRDPVNYGLDSDESGKSHGSISSDRSRGIRFKSVVPGSKVDDKIHGGNFFIQMFGINRKGKERKSPRKSAESKSEMKKRTQSCGSLDAAVRNGAEVTINADGKPKPKSGQNDLFKPGAVIAPKGKQSTQQQDRSRRKKNLQRKQKLAFTEYHNSNRYATDTTASYLGEEKSVQRGSNFAKINELHRNISSGKESLQTVSEEVKVKVSLTLLTPVEGPDAWIENRRYLMAPAIMAICPMHVYSLFQHSESVGGSITNRMFAKLELGVAEAAQIVTKGLLKEEYEWSSVYFVLHQNYLLEYDTADRNCRPRGFAFLQNASIRRFEAAEADKLRFDYYQPEKSSRKSIVVKLASEAERDRWISCLSEAARLKVEDLYEFDSSSMGEVLGRGRFATVYPGRRRQEKRNLDNNSSVGTNQSNGSGGILKKKPSFTSFANLTVPLAKDDYECALKVIDKHKFWDRVRKDEERSDSIVREASVQAALLATDDIYPGFLKVKSFFETTNEVILELELLDGADLYQYISSKESVSEVEAAQIMFDIINCLDAMEANGITHRDIKPANILMADKDSSGITVKLGDFGMAAFVGPDNLVRGRCGTPGYVAPEILAAKQNDGYKNKVDMFSAGVLLYILLCGYEPFSHAKSEKELISENTKAKVEYPAADWSTVSVEGRDLVEQMLERDPSKRIEPKKALQHPWITRRATPNKPTMTTSSKASLEDFACSIS